MGEELEPAVRVLALSTCKLPPFSVGTQLLPFYSLLLSPFPSAKNSGGVSQEPALVLCWPESVWLVPKGPGLPPFQSAGFTADRN